MVVLLGGGSNLYFGVSDVVFDYSNYSYYNIMVPSSGSYFSLGDVVSITYSGFTDVGLDDLSLLCAIYNGSDGSYSFFPFEVEYDPISGFFSASFVSDSCSFFPYIRFQPSALVSDVSFVSIRGCTVSIYSSDVGVRLGSILGTSSNLPFSSGSLSADVKSKNGSLGSVAFGEQPPGDYLININHTMTDCDVYFNVLYKNRYLYTSSSPGVTTCLVSHEGGDLTLTVSYSAQRTTAYEVTGGYVEGESSVSGSGEVVGSGTVSSIGGIHGSTSSGSIQNGTGYITSGNIYSDFGVNGSMSVAGESSVEGSGYVTGEIYTTAPTAWNFSVSSIVAISVVGAAADQYGFFAPFVGFFKDFLPEQLAGIKASLYSGFTRMTDKLQEIFDKQEQSYEDATDEAVSEGYDEVAGKHEEEDAYTQDAISNVDQTFDALELPSLEEQQTVIDGIGLLNVAVFDGFFANTQMRFLLFFSLSLALASFVLRMSS